MYIKDHSVSELKIVNISKTFKEYAFKIIVIKRMYIKFKKHRKDVLLKLKKKKQFKKMDRNVLHLKKMDKNILRLNICKNILHKW